MYSINFTTLIINLLPHFLRKDKMLAWLLVILKPVILVYGSFLDYRNAKLYEAQITGQVISLEKMLNDTFHDEQSGAIPIYITDSQDQDEGVLLFNAAESETETWLFNQAEVTEPDTMIFNSGEGQSGYGFIVYVDVALPFDRDLMVGMINKYKLAGTTYKIIIVQ